MAGEDRYWSEGTNQSESILMYRNIQYLILKSHIAVEEVCRVRLWEYLARRVTGWPAPPHSRRRRSKLTTIGGQDGLTRGCPPPLPHIVRYRTEILLKLGL